MQKIGLVIISSVFAVAFGPAVMAASVSSQDKMFVQEAAIGGMAEVQEAQSAASAAKAADVKQFGQHMIADHTPNNKELMALAERKGLMPPTTLDARHAQKAAMLKATSGAAFDSAYIKGEIDGHREMAALMQTEMQSGTDPDLKAFAKKTLPVVQEHLEMAQKLQGKANG